MAEEKERKVIKDAVSVRELRDDMADVINEVAIYGRTIFVTNRTRRVIGLVNLSDIAELEEYRSRYGPLTDK